MNTPIVTKYPEYCNTVHSYIYSDCHPPVVLPPVMAVPIIAEIPADIAAAVGKSAATVGGSIAGGVASYYIIDSVRDKDQPQISHAILTSASENKSDSFLAVNFGGAESGLILIIILILATFVT